MAKVDFTGHITLDQHIDKLTALRDALANQGHTNVPMVDYDPDFNEFDDVRTQLIIVTESDHPFYFDKSYPNPKDLPEHIEGTLAININ